MALDGLAELAAQELPWDELGRHTGGGDVHIIDEGRLMRERQITRIALICQWRWEEMMGGGAVTPWSLSCGTAPRAEAPHRRLRMAICLLENCGD